MKKSIFISLLIIALTIGFISATSIVSGQILNDLESELKNSESTAEYKRVEESFNRREGYLSFFIADNVLLEIRASFGEIIAYAEEGSVDEMNAAKNRLCARLCEQRRLCGLNFSPIF